MKLAKDVIQKPLPPEKTGELLEKVGSNWLFGQGIGETALMVGGIFVFPPYAIYVLGNGALQVAGYKPLHITDALPEDARNGWNYVYDSVTAVPGSMAASVSGQEYRQKDVIAQDYVRLLESAYSGEGEGESGGSIQFEQSS
ncbi:MAG: hypothetical protein GYA55_09445 [SAR324 cluster bacterium]|uniref:Uncharacterized protein n=1 Tax=SAR324 cluster bacterium TaxID=2024889 RepID=A0A7X9IKQ7_9DELT|nr:hypothetical protein [SAR324 cluster bacterium]